MSFGGKNACFFGCPRLTQDTCTLHQRKYGYVVLITITVLNIGADRSDPDQTVPSYEQSDQGLPCFAFPPASFVGICIHSNIKKVLYDKTAHLLFIKLFDSISKSAYLRW